MTSGSHSGGKPAKPADKAPAKAPASPAKAAGTTPPAPATNEGELIPAPLSLGTRLMAWWEGYDLSGIKIHKKKGEEDGRDNAQHGSSGGHGSGDEAASGVPQPGMNRFNKPLWSATRIEVVEKLWGTGFVTPGGVDFVPELVRPLGLNPAMTVLDLSAGLGGTTRTMAGQFGAWVTGLETTPNLALEGMQRSIKAGMAKQAPIDLYDPENFSYPKRVDAVFAKEAFYTVTNKDGLFDAVERVLKPRGQVLFTDYILPNAGGTNNPTIKAWAAREPLEPKLWTLAQMVNALTQRNLDVRINEDITDKYRHMILKSLQDFTGHIGKYVMDHETKSNVMEEIELWAFREKALHSGLLCCRFYALKPGE
ncbi:SAM-dependent methyltransferase [uncultured Gammaproteobacteria bacterium]